MMPYREFSNAEEMKDALSGLDSVIIDATERNIRRSQNNNTQKEQYSGKKRVIC